MEEDELRQIADAVLLRVRSRRPTRAQRRVSRVLMALRSPASLSPRLSQLGGTDEWEKVNKLSSEHSKGALQVARPARSRDVCTMPARACVTHAVCARGWTLSADVQVRLRAAEEAVKDLRTEAAMFRANSEQLRAKCERIEHEGKAREAVLLDRLAHAVRTRVPPVRRWG